MLHPRAERLDLIQVVFQKKKQRLRQAEVEEVQLALIYPMSFQIHAQTQSESIEMNDGEMAFFLKREMNKVSRISESDFNALKKGTKAQREDTIEVSFCQSKLLC